MRCFGSNLKLKYTEKAGNDLWFDLNPPPCIHYKVSGLDWIIRILYVFPARFQQKFYFYDPGDQIEQKLETTEHHGSVRTYTWMEGGGRRCYHLWFTKDFDIKIPQFDIMIKVGLMIKLKQLLQGLFIQAFWYPWYRPEKLYSRIA